MEEYTYESLTVVVDATFAHRIDEGEREEFEAAVLAGEIVTPPAGIIGRGDAFILQVAEKVGAAVFSNDSFQEFHGEHKWLFDDGRLIGGKPVSNVGWIFSPRVPVRGAASRRSVREAGGGGSSSGRGSRRGSGRGSKSRAKGPAPKPSKSTPPPPAKKAAKGATKKSAERPAKKAGKERKATAKASSGSDSPEELNDPRTFLGFVTQYSIGDDIEGVVERFSSHGCYLRAAGAQCYLPSRAMGDPPPSRARDVVSQGQSVIVKVESLDSDRRGINVVLVRVIPRDDQKESKQKQTRDSRAKTSRSRNPAKTAQEPTVVADDEEAQEGYLTRSTTNVATKKTTARKSAKKATKRTAAKKAAPKKAAKATSSPRAKRAAARKAAPKKTAAKKAAPKKAAAKKSAAKKTAAKKTAAKKTAAKKTTKKATAKKTTKKAAPKKAAAKKSAAKKAAPKKTAAKKTTKKATAKKTAAKKTTKKATAKKTAAKKR